MILLAVLHSFNAVKRAKHSQIHKMKTAVLPTPDDSLHKKTLKILYNHKKKT